MLALTVFTVNTYLARWLAFIPASGAMQCMKCCIEMSVYVMWTENVKIHTSLYESSRFQFPLAVAKAYIKHKFNTEFQMIK